jgi:hypothetical protein
MTNLKTKFAPYEDQNIWDLDEDQVFDCFTYWLEKSLHDQKIEECEVSYQYMSFVLHWYLNMIGDDFYHVDFVLFHSAWIYLDDEDFMTDSAKHYELAKIIYLDEELKKYIESILSDKVKPYGLELSTSKRLYLEKALDYAKNFHPNYLPEDLFEY